MISVHLNGVRLMPMHDYTIVDERVNFTQVPRHGDLIQIATPTSNCQFYGNDIQVGFPITESIKKSIRLGQLMDDLLIYMDNPTVKDQLERLQVVLELVKNPPNEQ